MNDYIKELFSPLGIKYLIVLLIYTITTVILPYFCDSAGNLIY